MAEAHDNPIEEARNLARQHRLFIVDVHEKVGERWVPAWVVYRRLPGDAKARLGRRSNPVKLLHFVRQLIGEPEHV